MGHSLSASSINSYSTKKLSDIGKNELNLAYQQATTAKNENSARNASREDERASEISAIT